MKNIYLICLAIVSSPFVMLALFVLCIVEFLGFVKPADPLLGRFDFETENKNK